MWLGVGKNMSVLVVIEDFLNWSFFFGVLIFVFGCFGMVYLHCKKNDRRLEIFLFYRNLFINKCFVIRFSCQRSLNTNS